MQAQEQYILQGLINRGLPQHVAQAFVMNFKDESGLNPGINEHNPTVPGSRGGFGLYQLTGPRRVAYENFAQQRGVDPADTDAQLDFLMVEGKGPERAAFQKILSAPDVGSAAAAITTDFLRPAPQHQASRVAKYTGDSMVPRDHSAQVAAQTNTSPPPFSFGFPGTPLPPGVADYANDDKEKKSPISTIAAALSAVPNAPNPISQFGGDANASGNLLNKALSNPTIASILMDKRLGGLLGG